jgi:F-type H+-transporting ATPase subunit delta
VSLDPVTTRWTEALFRLAKRQGVLDAVRADVERLGVELARPGVRSLLAGGGRAGSGHAPAERRAKLEQLVAGAQQLVRNLVSLLLDKRREEVLLQLAEAFRQRMLVERGAVEGVVESARPLAPAEVTSLAQALGKDLGKEVLLASRSNPELIGGVRVVFGARMLDRSVQGRLEGLRGRLLAARLPAKSR